MSPVEAAWWDREAGPARPPRRVPGGAPELVEATRESVRTAIRSRLSTFTPEWTNPTRADAGVALVRLFGVLAEPVLARANRLPEKTLVEHLRIAGVGPLPATAAAALLELTVSDTAGGSVLVPAGFQAGAGGATDEVVFETAYAVHATPATLTDVAVSDGGLLSPVDLAIGPAAPFGRRPRPGDALWIGLTVPPGTEAPFPELSLGIGQAAGAAGPVVAGAEPETARLAWEVLDAGRPVPAELRRDETGGLRTAGVVTLGVPRRWRPAPPPGAPGLPSRHWLRVRLVAGDIPGDPVLAAVRVNVAAASAVRTVRDEPLERIPDEPGGTGTRMRLAQAPVLPGSLVLETDDDPGGDVFGTGTPTGPAGDPAPWREVQSLAGYGPDDRVFVLDPAGEVTFGDGVTGARVPDGFRTVRAVRYRVGGGRAGHVAAEAVGTPLTSIPFVTAVTNPFPASGGTDPEPVAATTRRGPAELRSGSRAVTPADYGLLARRAPGADVARAEGVAGLHPGLPGRPVPGVVGVLVVPPDRGGGAPPAPGAADLAAVTRFLAGHAAPVGVTVVAAGPRYQPVTVTARFVPDPDDDQVTVLRAAAAALDRYLHPLTGGEAGTGWPLGGTVRHGALVRVLLALPGIRAVPLLTVTVAGIRHPACADAPVAAHALLWPGRHVLVPVGPSDPGGAP